MLGRGRSRWIRAALAPIGALATMLASTHEASAYSKYLEVPPREEVMASPSFRYANMTNDEAFAELDRRGIAYRREGEVTGVRAPIRLAGKLHGVDIHSVLPPEERATTMFEILDARLALALDDFTVILAKHEVVEVVHYTMYRPNVPKDEAPDAAIAATGAQPTKAKPGVKAKKVASTSPVTKGDLGNKATKADKATSKTTVKKGRQKEAEDAFDLKDPITNDVDPIETAELGAKAGPKVDKRSDAKSDKKNDKKIEKPSAGAQRATTSPPRTGKSAKTKVYLPTNEKPHGKWAPPGTRHPAGLAIDVGSLKKSDGTVLNVGVHFHGKVGDKTCGADVPEAPNAEARELRSIVCEAREAGVFTYALTPNFDAAHVDHFHLEIKGGVYWFLYQ
jgi:hypothetical protein